MGAVNSFKEKAERNLANYSLRKKEQGTLGAQNQLETDGARDLIRKAQENTTQQKSQDVMNKALQSSRQQNVQQNFNNGANLNNQIANLNEIKNQEAQIQKVQQEVAQRNQAILQNQQKAQQKVGTGSKQPIDETQQKLISSTRARLEENKKLLERSRSGEKLTGTVGGGNKYMELGNRLPNNALLTQTPFQNNLVSIDKQLENAIKSDEKLLARYENGERPITLMEGLKLLTGKGAEAVGNFIMGEPTEDEGLGKTIVRSILNMPAAIVDQVVEIPYSIMRAFTPDNQWNTVKERADGTYDIERNNDNLVQRFGYGATAVVDAIDLLVSGGGKNIAENLAKPVAKQTFKQIAGDVLKNSFEEGLTEMAQNLTSELAEKGGFDEGTIGRTLKAGVAGASTGVVMGGTQASINAGRVKLGINKQARQIAEQVVKENPGVDYNTAYKQVKDILNQSINENVTIGAEDNEQTRKYKEEFLNSFNSDTDERIAQAQAKINTAVENINNGQKNTNTQQQNIQNQQKQRNALQDLMDTAQGHIDPELDTDIETPKTIEEQQARIENATEESKADVAETESATGQKIDPNQVEVVEGAEGTQASEAIVTDQTREELGKMTASFLKDHEGKEITAEEWEGFAQKLAKKVDSEFAVRRKKLEKVAKKLESGRREGATTQAEARLTAIERELMNKVQQELDVIRENARASGAKDIGEGDYGEMYFPNRLKGADQITGADYILQGFDQRKPGNEFSRKGKLGLEELDFTSDAIIGYVREYATPDAVRESKIAQQILSEESDARSEMAAEGAKKIREVQDAVNKASTEGLIKRKTKVDIDVVDKLSEAGKDFGFRQQVVESKLGRGLTDEQKLTATMMPNGKSAFETYGFLNQQRSPLYAGQQVAQNIKANNGNIDFNSLAQTVDTTLQEDFNISNNKREKLVKKIMDLPSDSPREVVFSELHSLYDSAAQSQFYRASMRYQVTDPALKTMLNNHGVDTLRWGTMRKSAAIKIVDSVRRDMNSAYRLLNVSSAINELGDIPSILTAFGKDGFTSLVPRKGILTDFGLTDGVNIDPALDAKIMNSTPKEAISKINQIHDKALANYYVEKYKASVVLTASEKVHLAENMSGNALTDAVLYDYKNIALPVDQFSKTFLDNYPLLTQYMSWNLRNMQKEGRLLTGNLDAGVLGSKSKGQRIAINAFTNLPAKTVWWLVSNAMKGTALTAAFGLMDLGMYSDVNDGDRDIIENIAQVLPQSPVSQIIVQCYEIAHRQLLKEQYAESVENGEKTYNPYEDADATAELLDIAKNSFIPGISQINKTVGFLNDQDKGYTENAKGKVKYAMDDDFLNNAKGFVFGSNQTDAGREYSGNKSIFQRMNEGRGFLDALTDMTMEDLEMKDRDYQRPANDLYSTAIKMDARENMTAGVGRARKFNDLSQELKNAYSDAYNNNKDSLGIEYYRELYNNPDALNATIAKKQQLREDMNYFGGIPGFIEAAKNDPELVKYNSAAINDIWNPMWDLPLEDLRSVLEEKAAYTGDDIPLRNLNRLKDWYEDFNNEMSEYYEAMEKLGAYTEDDGSEMDRAAKWQKLNDKLNAFNIQSDGYQWGSFPLYEQMTALYDKYGEDSEEVKAWWRANYNAYQAEKVKKDEQRLAIINAMREIEGTDPMTLAGLMRADATGSTSDLEDWLDGLLNGGGSGGSGNGYSYAPTFSNTFAANPYYMQAKATGGNPKLTWKRASGAPFYAVPASHSNGTDPYSSVV